MVADDSGHDPLDADDDLRSSTTDSHSSCRQSVTSDPKTALTEANTSGHCYSAPGWDA